MVKFVDEVSIEVVAGNGGSGIVSFRRERCVPRGGPNGGDGGRGGDVLIQACSSINTLIDYRYQRVFTAKNGERGRGADQHGAAADAIALKVPVGTKVWDSEAGELLIDLSYDGQVYLLAKGGAGGLGNLRFKSSINRAPRQFTSGAIGVRRCIKLELNLLADVGLLGLPNSGKSTLIAKISNARPKIADYPFTTLSPQLGVVRVGVDQSFVVADVPGLVSGAADGVGLGHQFLRHLHRTRLLLHLVDLSQEDPIADIKTISEELQKYDPDFAKKPRWLVFNKIDTLGTQYFRREKIYSLVSILKKEQTFLRMFSVSGLTGAGCESLCLAVNSYLQVRVSQNIGT